MTKRIHGNVKPNIHPRGPRLVDYALWLIRENRMTNQEVSERFGVGIMWLSGVETGRVKSPSADSVQRIIEELTGKNIIEALDP